MSSRILELIKTHGVSASQLVTELGLNSTAVSEWKSGKTKPRAEHIAKLAIFFGVTSDYLLGLTDNPNPPENVLPYVSPEEFAIIEKLRSLPSEKRQTVETLLNQLL